jgi:fluoride ion exporter CrcB/FEX
LLAIYGLAGVFARFKLSILNKHWPIGTLISNTTGTVAFGILLGIEHKSEIPDGVLGCLTTVSTFIAEINVLEPTCTFRYLLLTLGINYLIFYGCEITNIPIC